MKFSRRLLCALCAFTLLLGCFSFTAKAATSIPQSSVKVYAESWLTSPYDDMFPETPLVTVEIGGAQKDKYNIKNLDTSAWGEKTLYLNFRYSFSSAIYSKIFRAGEPVSFWADGLTGLFFISHSNGIPETFSLAKPDDFDTKNIVVYLRYTNGMSEQISTGNFKYDIYDNTAGFNASFTPKYDVRSLSFEIKTKSPIRFMESPSSASLEVGAGPLEIGITIKDEEEVEQGNFFQRLIIKLQALRDDIKDGLTGGIDQRRGMWQTLKDTLTAVTNLPLKIWQTMRKGLVNLFIPDEAFMKQWVDKNRQWCTDTFGALYQSFDIIVNAYANIDASAETHVIDFPLVTIPLPENQTFTFGGYEVEIVPDGFEFFATICKSVVGIVCSFAFINGMRRRYDDIMEETK